VKLTIHLHLLPELKILLLHFGFMACRETTLPFYLALKPPNMDFTINNKKNSAASFSSNYLCQSYCHNISARRTRGEDWECSNNLYSARKTVPLTPPIAAPFIYFATITNHVTSDR